MKTIPFAVDGLWRATIYQLEPAASIIAAMPTVRQGRIAVQRDFAATRDVVMAGRDIGSVVLPSARFKFST